MSDSDSQSQQNFNLGKIAQEDQPQVKQVIEKGKKILPTYDDQALYGLYKRYYSVESIFINELHMIARRLKGDQDNEEHKKNQKWIKIGRQVKTKVNKTKYNFLEDKQLLRRAQQYLKSKKVLPERRQYFTNEQRQQNNRTYHNNRPQNNQSNNPNQSYQGKPKQKFVQKVEDQKVQNTQTQQKTVEVTKKVEASPLKEQKYKEKIQVPAVTKTKNQQTTPKVEEKKPVIQQQPKTQPVKTQEAPKKQEPKKQEPKKEEPKKVSQPVQQPIKQVEQASKPVEQKPVQKPEPVVQSQKPASQPVKQSQQSIPSSHSIPTVQNFDVLLAGKNFEQACNQNSFVLKFIQPQAYPQRISYVRTGDGGMKNVQIRVTGTSNQGSQKAL